ncbi:hypothetical protein [Phaeobacter inhibens]|uniref:hypothetical protein n=1 Tax=Phaeobacter inhibens TaxID=221822 RepID=UPI0021A31F54|nr:hypothetical protein [Phaeobacter inhibens]UWR88054.1 hypothetical protein K4L01_15035 [Phaeobacter inhibens]
MKTWQEQIPGCFAGMTAPFAMHPNDEKRALAMMGTMQEQGVNWREAEAAIRDYLTAQNVTQDEMRKKMQRVEERLKPWLS